MLTVAEELQAIDNFDKLLPFLKNRMGWPIEQDVLDEDDPLDEATFEFLPEELGINLDEAANIRGIRLLRPLFKDQPFGIFLVSFEDKDLKITAMRRILRALVKRKRENTTDGTQQRWNANDLMFISNFGESGERKLSFAHFHQDNETRALPTLRVIGWDEDDTAARMRIQAGELTQKLKFPDDPTDMNAWREQWVGAFTRKPGQTIATTKSLVTKLAKLATGTRLAIEEVMRLESQDGVLHGIMNSFKNAIFPDLKPDAFANMYAQTVAYGLLQAQISRQKLGDLFLDGDGNPDKGSGLVLDDAANVMEGTNPFLKELFESFLLVGNSKSKLDFDEIGLSDVRDLLADADMEGVLADFGHRNPNQDPSIHLYEDFLRAYDEDASIKHGVFYTPKEVVGFIVRSVHETLQNDFGLPDGLADTTTWAEFSANNQDMKIPEGWADKPFVQILDPATGTGTFLIETIGLIHVHMLNKWRNAGKSDDEIIILWQKYVPTHLLPRLHGFELMMAPYAMAHLGIALKLSETGYKKVENARRAEVYLTNSLTEAFDSGKQSELIFFEEALAEEGKGANHIKMNVPITVVIGNPPYSGISQNMTTWTHDLLHGKFDGESYYKAEGNPLNEKKIWLQDDYVKFFKLAEMLINRNATGVLGLITNHGYLDNPTFRGMRESIISSFQKIKILDLHGNSSKKETAPDGSKDVNVFDIKAGVSIFIGSSHFNKQRSVLVGDIYGPRKHKLQSLSKHYKDWDQVKPKTPYFFFADFNDVAFAAWRRWFQLDEIFLINNSGIVTARDKLAIDYSKDALQEKLEEFISPEKTDDEIREIFFGNKKKGKYLQGDSRGWTLPEARTRLRNNVNIADVIKYFAYRPFDKRVIAFTNTLVDWPRTAIMQHMIKGDNLGLVTVRQLSGAGLDWSHSFLTDSILESTNISNRTKEINYLFPLKLMPTSEAETDPRPNLSPKFITAITVATGLAFQPLIIKNSEQQQFDVAPKKLVQGSLSELELHEHGDMTTTFGCRDAFDYIYAVMHSPTYRAHYVEFLKSDFPRIPLPKGRDVFAALASLGAELVAMHLLDTIHPKLAKPSIVFRGQGNNRLSKKGDITWDNGKMPINTGQWFEDVPQASVEFSIGGYQPLEKWLKDRAEKGGKNAAPGRILTEEDILHYRRMVVSITETQRIMQEIDVAIEKHGGWPAAFAG